MIYLTSVNIPDADRIDAYISAVRDGNSAALEKLYAETKAAVYSFALSILKNRHDAEDVLHDCYVSIYSSAFDYKSSGKPMAWIMTITRNLCYMKLRRGAKQADISAEARESYHEKEDGVSAEDRLIIKECMNSLSDEERQIIVLHSVAGFKHRETAQLLGLPLSTVLSKYNRAVKKLKKIMQEEIRS